MYLYERSIEELDDYFIQRTDIFPHEADKFDALFYVDADRKLEKGGLLYSPYAVTTRI